MDKSQFEKYKNLGRNIAYYRKLRDYTQLEFSEVLNIDRTHMGNIELARSGVSLDVLFRISDVLEVPVPKFFEVRDYRKSKRVI